MDSSNVTLDIQLGVPEIFQTDYNEIVCHLDGEDKSVNSSGCGAASASMAVKFFNASAAQTPYTMFKWAYENGYYHGNGLDHDCVSKLCELYGVSAEWTTSLDEVIQALKAGNPVIANMGKGVFTSYGHYIIFTGIHIENGETSIYVNDPNSRTRTGKHYPLSLISKERRCDSAFCICT